MSFLVRLPEELYDAKAFDQFAGEDFSIGAARAMAWLAQLSYEDETDKIDRILALWGLARLLVFRRTATTPLPLVNTRGLIASGRDAAFVAFAGTDPLVAANWATDFAFLPNAEAIHTGFATALDVAWGDIAGALAAGLPSGGLFLCGHSLGAALAVLCARRALREGAAEARAVYTFGMPRAGGTSFVDDYNSKLGGRTFRLAHGEDIVVTVPPLELGFRHVGRLLRCGRGERFDAAQIEAEPSEGPRIAPTLQARWIFGDEDGSTEAVAAGPRPDPLGRLLARLPPPISDHLPESYWHALRRA